MTSFTDGLLSTLATPRPTEQQLRPHIITRPVVTGGLAAGCTCGDFYAETTGRDASSRAAITSAISAHRKATS